MRGCIFEINLDPDLEFEISCKREGGHQKRGALVLKCGIDAPLYTCIVG